MIITEIHPEDAYANSTISYVGRKFVEVPGKVQQSRYGNGFYEGWVILEGLAYPVYFVGFKYQGA